MKKKKILQKQSIPFYPWKEVKFSPGGATIKLQHAMAQQNELNLSFARKNSYS